MRAIVVLNSAAGSITGADAPAALARVREAFAQTSLEVQIRAVDHAGLSAAVREAAEAKPDVVILGGGDGTIGTGAAALAGGSTPLGILPLGTLNHFAKDVGVPLELERAVATIEAGHVSEIDVGEVNGRVFLNNSSIGLYPTAVAEREELRHRNGGGKWLAMLSVCLDLLRRFPLLDVTLQAKERALALTTPFVFIGNNRYDMSLFALGTRASLQDGLLSVYLTRNTDRLGLVALALRGLLGRLSQDRDFRSFALTGVEIRTGRRAVRVSLDGEVVQMTSPIRYSIRPRALRVLTPRPAVAAAA